MIDHVHTLVVYLPVCCSEGEVKEEGSGEGDDIFVYGFTSSRTVPLESGVYITEYVKQRSNS